MKPPQPRTDAAINLALSPVFTVNLSHPGLVALLEQIKKVQAVTSEEIRINKVFTDLFQKQLEAYAAAENAAKETLKGNVVVSIDPSIASGTA